MTDPSRRLRRELGRLESYAAMIGILVGAGIFRVTGDAWTLTGSSVILGYAVLSVPVLATAVAYMVFASTSLGEQPGAEYTHISRTFGGPRLAFVGAWLKIVSFVGALAYLAHALADYALALAPALDATPWRLPIATAALAGFFALHAMGVRWFGRVQVVMLAVLGVSLFVLVVPGLAAIEVAHYRPFFADGALGFARALLPLFFAFAGFEAVAHTAGELRHSRRNLPGILLRGILITTAIFVAMSVVAFGTLPGATLASSGAPMAEVAAVYLPRAGATLVDVGAIMALATSLSATMYVPSRIAIVLAADGLAPRWLGSVHAGTGTPLPALGLTFALACVLLWSGQLSLALGIAVRALMLLYLLHSVALLMLPRLAPALAAEVTLTLPGWLRTGAALVSIGALAAMASVGFLDDVQLMRTTTFGERLAGGSLTSLELLAAWAPAGAALYRLARAAKTS